ncbi:radical SAM protein [Labilibaculum sp.]|uniref:radical SAM protein n=1 Tax=Labilibaculum sp. TaxID=2060723 RepID=UPI00356952D5
MESYFHSLNELVSKCKLEFSVYPEIRWINSAIVAEVQEKRTALLSALDGNLLFKNTKPYYNQISKGCQYCGVGLWSCLFVTGKCNGSCFYCPAPQDSLDDVPTTQGLFFPTAESYAEYVNHFKFKAVAFSGGEPLLVAEKVLKYLKRIRKVCPPETYTWMYTNGILGTETIYKKLASLNLNEIRFDIGATAYSLDKVKLAKGIIKNISIEIPAVPEEVERLKLLLPEMVKLGVSNLNLHQLRLTHHNAKHLLKRNYTYIPAEKPIVLESELAALELINYAKGKGIQIGINYCSFYYKNRFQQAGFRNQIANALADSNDVITQRGFIRSINKDSISYETMHLYNSETAPVGAKKLDLNFKKYAVTRNREWHQQIENVEMNHEINNLILSEPKQIPEDLDLFDIWKYEYIEKDLRDL